MVKATLSVQGDKKYISEAATEDLFGGNIILHRDDANLDSFTSGSDAMALTSLRYPGGAESELFFDLEDPNGTHQSFVTPEPGPDGEAPWINPTIPLSDFIDQCDAANQSMIFVMPTVRWTGTERDDSGNRYEDIDEKLVRSFTLDLLEECLDKGVPLEAFELGNEWWIDQVEYWGENLSAVEYGRIASRLSVIIDKAIDDFVASHDLPSNWERPDIVVQTGPGTGLCWVTPEGEAIPKGYTGPVVSSTELIFNEFNTNAEQSAVTGLALHDYTSGPYENINGFRYDQMDLWDELAADDPDWGELDRYVTEWNVKRDNATLTGLMQANAMVDMMAEMMRNGVDNAYAWPVQHTTTNSLTLNTGDRDEPYLGLSAGGQALRMMAESLPGLSLMNVSGEPATVDVTAFGGDDRVVLFIANTTGSATDVMLDVSKLVGDFTHVWGTLLGADGNPLDPNVVATITNLTAEDLVNDGRLDLDLEAYELMRVEFTIRPVGATIEGYVGDDELVGAKYADVIEGRSGADDLVGGGGNDTVFGDEGSDFVDGGEGADRLEGSEGADRLYGGDGNDKLKGGAAADTLAGSVGSDLIYGGDGADTIWGDEDADSVWGGDGSDTLQGNYGKDVLFGEAGADLLKGGANNDALYGGSGADRVEGADLDDSLFGDDGTDQLLGSSGNDTLFGGAGDDSLEGGDQADQLFGGSGSDWLEGGSGLDVADYSRSTSAVVADLESSGASRGEAEGDVFSNIESLRGGDYSDALWGDGGDNTLWGRDGADLLAGREGEDLLVGGGGKDTFEFNKGWDADRIDDFRDDADTILLTGFGLSSASEAMQFATQSGSDVVFDFGSGDRLIVSDTTLSALQNDLMVS